MPSGSLCGYRERRDGRAWREIVYELNTKTAAPLQLHTRVTCFIDCGTIQSISSLTFLVLPPSQSFSFTAAQLPKGFFFFFRCHSKPPEDLCFL